MDKSAPSTKKKSARITLSSDDIRHCLWALDILSQELSYMEDKLADLDLAAILKTSNKLQKQLNDIS